MGNSALHAGGIQFGGIMHGNICIGKNTICNPAICSWDPNTIEVIPEGCGVLGYILPTDILTYRINFQNTGNAPTNRVQIIDTINNTLDPSSILLTNSSHAIDTFRIEQDSVLVWIFGTPASPFNLPDSLSYNRR